MNISQAYRKYSIPKNLQRHMLHAASLSDYISKSRKGIINRNEVITALLLHDIGNLLKFDLAEGMELFDRDEQDKNYCKKIQSQMKEKYGSNEFKATINISEKLGINSRIIHLIEATNSSDLSYVIISNDYSLKVCVYSDFRVSPKGFISIEKLFKDIIKRYGKREGFIGVKK